MTGGQQGDRGDGTEGGEEGKGEERRRGRRRKIVANGIKGSIKGPRGPKKSTGCTNNKDIGNVKCPRYF